MKPILDNLLALGRTKLIALGATGLGLVLALVIGLNLALAPSFAPLYTDLSLGAAGRVVSALEQDGFKVELSGGGTIVSVPQPDVARARMALAEQGLPDEGTAGWEIFDQSSGLGMNSFMQQVSRLRALEGELARSIQTIEGVDAARVHLVLPEREAFSRTRPEPSASVIVRGRVTSQISRRQGLAIRALVASAVPELSPSRVTVLSASGETILSEEVEGEAGIQAAGATMEERLQRSITEMLTARVGAGNARVQVNVELSNAREVIRQQSFDPAQQVVRSTETRQEESQDRDGGEPEVGVANNLPAELGGGVDGGAGSASNTTRNDEIVNYEIGSTQSETVREPGAVQRISVAVLVNGIYNVASNGETAYQERSPEEIERLTQLVRSAIGFDEARGDQVSVDSLRFMDYSMDLGAPVGLSLGQTIAQNFGAILRGSFALALVAAVLAFGLRPLLRRMVPEPGLALAGADAGFGGGGTPALGQAFEGARQMLPGGSRQQAEPGALPAAGTSAAAVAGGAAPDGAAAQLRAMLPEQQLASYDPDEMVALASVDGKVRRQRLVSVGDLVESEPVAALKVVQGWLAEEDRA
ncbi:flagellar basal-body MS-ring/collar protein FliF [Limimaricola pyoseonensis]|uniref:Flagellar M-ring protein n=1 Tax=Limimaricola pyoseonensis TaxID=521013 RepID=A0A1G7KCE5_9RHOB|nr:flagellar basal-body MS-ring/collar protein FliF [Limimaricola pyoseonensis]SDF34837.1 flagellar M-ring protein FliF [Limimaricola pyoseonensis]